MTRAGIRFSVDLIGATGPVLFELHRLCDGFVRVGSTARERGEGVLRLAMLRFPGAQPKVARLVTAEIADRTLSAATQSALQLPLCPTFELCLGADSHVLTSEAHVVERFNIGSPSERLALLARLATLARTDARRPVPGDVFASVPLYARVAAVQRAFAPRLTESDLADRIGIDVSTLRRWFARIGVVRPGRFLQWVRLHDAAIRLTQAGESFATVAQAYGYSTPSNLRRSLSTLADVSVAELLQPDGQTRFLRRILSALQPRDQKRASARDRELAWHKKNPHTSA